MQNISSSRLEAYAQGLTTFENPGRINGPSWATELGWDGVGCWITTTHESLVRAVPGLVIKSHFPELATILIAKAPTIRREAKDYFAKLEQLGINLAAQGFPAKLVCEGATLERDPQGTFYFAGLFFLEITLKNGNLRSVVGTRLDINTRVADVAMPRGANTVEYFECDCDICLSAGRIADYYDDMEFVENPKPLGSFRDTAKPSGRFNILSRASFKKPKQKT